jgi:hypothetical protein
VVETAALYEEENSFQIFGEIGDRFPKASGADRSDHPILIPDPRS